MLSGEYKHNIDPKNRIFIPAKHREELGNYIVIARSIREECLKVYSKEGWEEYCNKIKQKLDGEDAENVLRFLNRNAANVEPDSQGRVTIPFQLLKHAHLINDNKEAYVVGCGDFAQIWEASLYEAMINLEDARIIGKLLSAKGL